MEEEGRAKMKESPLKEAMRTARIEAAERSGVVVELRDAEAARLEMLNEALEPLFKDIPGEHLDIFDRAVSAGTTPRLWLDMVTHVAMGRDKRTYRLLQDTVHGRRVIAESSEIEPMVDAVTRYVGRRLVAREQVLAASLPQAPERRRGGRAFALLLGLLLGAAAVYLYLIGR
jgi:hypothetical protein